METQIGEIAGPARHVAADGSPPLFPLRQGSSAFTLIELLIVVAIIGILASIATPNFLEAQIRAKVARAKADMVALATAVEIYAVDHTDYPPRQNDPNPPDVRSVQGTCARFITTPVAYISSYPAGPFGFVRGPQGRVPSVYLWIHVRGGLGEVYAGDGATALTPQLHGMLQNWKTHGIYYAFLTFGPDGDAGEVMFRPPLGQGTTTDIIEYDPTNGTVSIGFVSRGSTAYPVGK